MPPSVHPPLLTLCLAALTITCAWSIIASSFGSSLFSLLTWLWPDINLAIDAYVKSHHDQHLVSALAPQGAVINLEDGGAFILPIVITYNNYSDIFSTGVAILTVCLVIFIFTCLYIVMLLTRPVSFSSSRFITYQVAILAFLAAWLFAVLVPYTYFFSTRSVTVTVSIGGQPLPQSIVDALLQTLGRQNGLSTRYRDHAYREFICYSWYTYW